MQAYIKLIILCIAAGLVSSAVHRGKEKTKILDGIKPFLFYVGIFYAGLIVIKKFARKTSVALLSCFASDSMLLYLLWAVPLILLGAVVPLILKKIFQKRADDFISMSLSIMISMGMIIWFLLGEINTRMLFCIIVGGGILSFPITLFYKKEVYYCNYREIKKYFQMILPVVSFWIILMVLYLPNELYLNNVGDMEIPYGNYVLTLLFGSAVYFIEYFVGYTLLSVCFCTEEQLRLVNRAFFAITLAGYIQGLMLNGKMNQMDGMRQEWSTADKMGNLLFWVVLIGGIVILPCLIKKNIDKIYATVCIYISLILLVSWGYMGVTTPKGIKDHYELTDEGRFELSSQNNVLVFVLDWFDWQIADRIFEADPDFSEPLKDFTWYKNSTSCYAFTAMSIPYLLTNVEWQYDMGREEYRDYAYENASFLKDIADQNYDIGIYTYSYYLTEDVKGVVRNYAEKEEPNWNYLKVADKMVECSKYKSFPFLLKENYWYYVDSRFFMKMKDGDTLSYNPGDDEQFYDALLSEKVHTMENETCDGAYRFYHLVGAHPPFEPDMFTKGKNCLNIVYEYLDQLKEEGLYNDATIIITADHGQNYLDSGIENILESYDLEAPSSPILFIKEPGQKNMGSLQISMAPVSHAEIAATVMDAISDGTIDYGDTVWDIPVDSERERKFVYKSGMNAGMEYLIRGNVHDWENWHLQEP